MAQFWTSLHSPVHEHTASRVRERSNAIDSANCVTNLLFTGTVQVRGLDILSVCLSGCHKTDLDQRDLIASCTWDVKGTELMEGGQMLTSSAAYMIILLCYITWNTNEVFQSNTTHQYSSSSATYFSPTNHREAQLYKN